MDYKTYKRRLFWKNPRFSFWYLWYTLCPDKEMREIDETRKKLSKKTTKQSADNPNNIV